MKISLWLPEKKFHRFWAARIFWKFERKMSPPDDFHLADHSPSDDFIMRDDIQKNIGWWSNDFHVEDARHPDILVLAGKHVSQALGYVVLPNIFQSRGLFVDFDFLIWSRHDVFWISVPAVALCQWLEAYVLKVYAICYVFGRLGWRFAVLQCLLRCLRWCFFVRNCLQCGKMWSLFSDVASVHIVICLLSVAR